MSTIAIVTGMFTLGRQTYTPGQEIDDPVTVALIQGNPAFLQFASIVNGDSSGNPAPASTTSPLGIPSPATLIEAVAGVNAVDYMTPVATDAIVANRIAPLATKGALGLEASRAQAAESTLTLSLAAEITRAQGAEQTNAAGVATNAQGIVTLTSNLTAEVVRAKNAEQTNSNAIGATNSALQNEVARAQGAEAQLVPQTTAVTAGAGMTGGGALSGGVTLSIKAQGITTGMLAPAPAYTVRANATASPASPTDVSPSALNDAVYGSSTGSILFRSATAWGSLAIGSQGQVLTVSSSGAPSWVTVSGTGTVTQVNTGTGLTGGPITGSGTIALSNLPVYADTAQSLTPAQQSQVRQNAGAAASGANSDIASVQLGGVTGYGGNVPGKSVASVNSATANFAAVAPGTAQGQTVGYDFYPTFMGQSDNGPRRAATIRARFNGSAWGTETIDFLVGNNGAANDSGAVPATVFSLSGSGPSPAPLPINQGGSGATTPAGALANLGAASAAQVAFNFVAGILF